MGEIFKKLKKVNSSVEILTEAKLYGIHFFNYKYFFKLIIF